MQRHVEERVELGDGVSEGGIDVLEVLRERAVEGVKADAGLARRLASGGVRWFDVQLAIEAHLPDTLDDRRQRAYRLVVDVMNAVFGAKGEAWETYRVDGKAHIRTLADSR